MTPLCLPHHPAVVTLYPCQMQNGTTPKSPAALRPSMALALARSPAATADADIADGVAPAAELGSHWAGLNRLVHQTHLTLKLPPRPPGGAASFFVHVSGSTLCRFVFAVGGG